MRISEKEKKDKKKMLEEIMSPPIFLISQIWKKQNEIFYTSKKHYQLQVSYFILNTEIYIQSHHNNMLKSRD